MRTNIDIDDALLADAMKSLGTTTKKATVEEALRRATRGYRLRQLIERTRGMGWDDGLSDTQRDKAVAEDGAPYDPKQ